VWTASDRAFDAATGSQSPSATERRLPPDLGERQVAAVAPNVLERSFEASAPNRKWIADFTYVWTAEGWLYVAAVVDLFSRRLVGWSMNAAMTAKHVTEALVMAIWRRGNLRSCQPIQQRAVPAVDGRSQRRLLNEPVRQRLGQRGDGKLLLVVENRTDWAQNVPNEGRRQGRRLRLY
jgi:transposase InsO family protein